MSDYVSLDSLRAAKQREDDVPLERLGVVCVRALTVEEIRGIRRAARDPETREFDGLRFQQLAIAHALVRPNLGADEDEAAALELVDRFSADEQQAIGERIDALTSRSASAAFPRPDAPGTAAGK